jgi:hypothetical protein
MGDGGVGLPALHIVAATCHRTDVEVLISTGLVHVPLLAVVDVHRAVNDDVALTPGSGGSVGTLTGTALLGPATALALLSKPLLPARNNQLFESQFACSIQDRLRWSVSAIQYLSH